MAKNPPIQYSYKPNFARQMGLYAPLLRGDTAKIQLSHKVAGGDTHAELTVKCTSSGTFPALTGGSKYLIIDGGNTPFEKGDFLKPEQITDAKVLDITNTTARNSLVRGIHAVRSAFKFFPAIS